MLDNLRFVFFTNENNVHLLKLTLKYFFKHTRLENIKVSVISNNYKKNQKLPFKNKVEYLNGNVLFSETGHHFGQSLKNTLPNIKEDYIFLFCDDYFFIDNTKINDLEKLMGFIVKENVDYFGFDDIARQEIYSWKRYEGNNFPFSNKNLYYRDNDYRYLYSVQPSIWKKESLLEIVNKFDISLHNLDETLPIIKQNNTFKCFSTNFSSHFSYDELKDYFIIAYLEVVRHGVFQHTGNNSSLSPDYPCVKFISKLIKEEKLKSRKEFEKLLFNI